LLSVLDVGLPALKQSFRAFAGSLRCSSKPQLTLPSRPIQNPAVSLLT